MLWIMLILFIVGEAADQVEFLKRCPPVVTVPDFNVAKYNDKWYEYAKYAVEPEIQSDCVTAIHFPYKNGSFGVKLTTTPSGGGKTRSLEYTAVPVGKFRNGKFKTIPEGAPYWVLVTDYRNYALVWSCIEPDNKSIQRSLRSGRIYTRARDPSDQVIGAVYTAVEAENLTTTDFIPTNRKKGGEMYKTEHIAVPIDKTRNAKFTLTSDGSPYLVLATDYVSWALVKSCINFGETSIRTAWIYTKARDPSARTTELAYVAVDAHKILYKSDFILTNKKDCPASY